MTVLLSTRAELRAWRSGLPPTASIGFVPTMGALHAGHMSLVRASQAQSDITVASLFVNPLQFGPNEDFARYPRTPAEDLELLRDAGVTAVFSPSPAEMYPADSSTHVEETAVSEPLCGAVRPGHFRGVTTVVLKLLNLVQPSRLYLGQKDAQQCAVIGRMIRDLDIPVELVRGPTVRESDELSLSSRNRYLNADDRAVAPALFQSLRAVGDLYAAGERSAARLIEAGTPLLRAHPRIEVQYFEIRDAETLAPLALVDGRAVVAIAARLGSTRLIDNIVLG
jgi:pantoate--beta-alanine ligase